MLSQKPSKNGFSAAPCCKLIQTPGKGVKIDVLGKGATTIDCFVSFLLPHLSSLKCYQTFVQELGRERREATLFHLAREPWLP